MIHTKALRDIALVRCSRNVYHTPPEGEFSAETSCTAPECSGVWGAPSKVHPKGFARDHGGRWVAVYRDTLNDVFDEGVLTATLFGASGIEHLPPTFRQGAPFNQESWFAGFHSVILNPSRGGSGAR